MVIGIDVDGVLADFNALFIERCIAITGRNLYPLGYEPTTWNYPESLGYTSEEVSKVWSTIKADPTFWQTIDPYPTTFDDISTLRILKEEGHDVYFITNRMGTRVKEQTERWLHRKGFFFPTVLLTAHKGLAAQTLGLDYYIDDRDLNVVDVKQTNTLTFLMDRPWNQEFDNAKYRIHRVKSVSDMFIGANIVSA